jgi:hypothetical protein
MSFGQSQTLIQLKDQEQTTIGSNARTLEINFQRRVTRAGMADFVSHPLGRASAEFVLLSKPHEYWCWRDHTTTYSEFKKEMVGSYRSATDGVPQKDHAVAESALVEQHRDYREGAAS